MNKKLIAAAVAAVFAAPMVASAESTIYGNIHTSITSNDQEVNGDDELDNWTMNSEDGQLGIQGSEDLGGGLKAIYKFEIDFETNGDGTTQARPSAADGMDEVWVGLTGNWGTFLVGREDTPYKTFMDSSKVDLLGDSIVDVDNQLKRVGAEGFERFTANGAIAYVSPTFSGFTFGAAVIPGEESGVKNTSSKEDNDGLADHFSLGANYVAGGLRVGAGYEEKAPLGDNAADQYTSVKLLGTSFATTVDSDDQKVWGIGASYTFGAFKVAGKYEDESNVGWYEDIDADRYSISGQYTFGNNEIGLTWNAEDIDVDGDDYEADGFGVFVAHNFSPRTKVYAAYASSEGDADSSLEASTGIDDIEDDRYGVGMIHSF